jgi:superfamily II DNA or RNA helicase
MTTELQLRPEQSEVVDAVSAAFRAGHKRVMVSACCGFGKTELATAMLQATERNGKPGVVFAHNREAVRMLTERLEKEGHRVVTITGSDSGKEKERKRLMFNPEQGEAQADILVASDAGATGMNIQRGQWLYQYDTPQTAMTHAQRQGRIFRTGQKNDVELIDGVADHPEVHKARERLATKYGLRDLMTSPMDGLDDTGVAHYIKQRQAVEADSPGSLF